MSAALHSIADGAIARVASDVPRAMAFARTELEQASQLALVLKRACEAAGVTLNVRNEALARVAALECFNAVENNEAAALLAGDISARLGNWLGYLVSLPADHPAALARKEHNRP